MDKEFHTHRYFAASNGGNGFVSYFDDIFSADEHSKIYIIKGGPGTGKSSFMKKMQAEFSKDCSSEAFFCSSDTQSLDGLIIKNNNRSIALLDGTAPHTTDPTFPVAIEKIINLGDSLNESALKNNIKLIKDFSKEKSKSYKTAYEYLGIVAKFQSFAKDELGNCQKDYLSFFKKLITETPKTGKTNIRLITSFSKNGFGYLNTLESLASRKFKVKGIYGSEYIFLRSLGEWLISKSIECTLSPSPMFNNSYDAILIPSLDTVFFAGQCNTQCECEIIDSTQFFDTGEISKSKEKMEFLWREREIFLWGAVDEFKNAAEAHTNLERIYSAAMNFENNNAIFEKTVAEIKECLLL